MSKPSSTFVSLPPAAVCVAAALLVWACPASATAQEGTSTTTTTDAKPTESAMAHHLTEVAHFDHFQVTGIAVSKTGRIFVNFPRWSNDYQYAVVEVMPDGTSKPYPDETWNSWGGKPPATQDKFTCVQSMYVDKNDALWIIDPASPGLNGVEPGGAKLVKIDLATNKVTQVIPFGADVAPVKSYLNDVRIDNEHDTAYLSESGVGAVVVVDLKTGKARRTLDEDRSVLAEKGVDLTINGKAVMTAEKDKPTFNIDGIALSPNNEYLYYQALSGSTLYRIKTTVLRDSNASSKDQSKAVEKLNQTFPCDGYWMDEHGNLYLTGLRQGAILKRAPDGTISTVVADPRIQWPDTMAEGPDGGLYFTCSQIHHMPRFNGGKWANTEPFRVFKFTP